MGNDLRKVVSCLMLTVAGFASGAILAGDSEIIVIEPYLAYANGDYDTIGIQTDGEAPDQDWRLQPEVVVASSKAPVPGTHAEPGAPWWIQLLWLPILP